MATNVDVGVIVEITVGLGNWISLFDRTSFFTARRAIIIKIRGVTRIKELIKIIVDFLVEYFLIISFFIDYPY